MVSKVFSSHSSSFVSIGGGKPTIGTPKGSVVLSLDAKKGDNGPDVDLSTHATSSGQGANKFSLKTTAKTGSNKVDNYKVKVGLGDWMDKPGDDDDIDFLICISGAKGGPLKAPFLPNKKANAVDFRCDINLKGIPLKAKLKNALDKDLKLVKCLDANGDPGWGYLGKVDDAKELLNFSFTSPKGKEVAKLAIDISTADHDGLHGL